MSSMQKCQKQSLPSKVPHRLYIEVYEPHLLRSRILAASMDVDGDTDDEGLGDVSMDIMSVTRL
jgi:hypothetical protein